MELTTEQIKRGTTNILEAYKQMNQYFNLDTNYTKENVDKFKKSVDDNISLLNPSAANDIMHLIYTISARREEELGSQNKEYLIEELLEGRIELPADTPDFEIYLFNKVRDVSLEEYNKYKKEAKEEVEKRINRINEELNSPISKDQYIKELGEGEYQEISTYDETVLHPSQAKSKYAFITGIIERNNHLRVIKPDSESEATLLVEVFIPEEEKEMETVK